MANDAIITLNPGVGGDNTDASQVTDPTSVVSGEIKRERVVIGGDAYRAAIADLFNLNTWQFPNYDDYARRQREDLEMGIEAQTRGQLFASERDGHPDSFMDNITRGQR